jgi:FlaA1/EpsC-like NDP-sugar epimerase
MPTPRLPSLAKLCADMVSMHRGAKIALMVGVDLLALPACFLVAMVLRLGDLDLARAYGAASYVAVAVVTIATFSLSDLYRAVIRFIDQRLLMATGLALAVAILCVYFALLLGNVERLPRSALAIYWFIAFSYVVTSRISVRNFLRNHMSRRASSGHTVAIYGADEPGAQLALAMRSGQEYRPVCFFDEKHVLNERTIDGLRVFHTDRLIEMVNSLCIRSIIIAIPSVSPERLREIMQRLAAAGVTTKILSRLLDLADERAPTESIRELKFEDLLGRAPQERAGHRRRRLHRQRAVSPDRHAGACPVAPARPFRIRAVHHQAGIAGALSRPADHRPSRLGLQRRAGRTDPAG